MKKLQQLTLILALCLLSSGLFAQVQSTLDLAFRQIEENQAEWGLTESDISDLRISDHVFSKYGEIDHYYFMQRYEGIDIFNAVTSVHVNANGKVVSPRHNFVSDLSKKVNTTVAQKSETVALQNVLQDLAIPVGNFDFRPKNRSEGVFTYDKGEISRVDIKVKPIYQVTSDSEVRLSWDIVIDPVDNDDYWNLRVDATNGTIIDKVNLTVYCSFEAGENHNVHSRACLDHTHVNSSTNEETTSAMMGGTYNVFAEMQDGLLFISESPVHGSRNLISDPADPTASPFGWHDVDGEEGAEFTTTRGNNVNAFLDVDDDDAPDAKTPVNGGEDLTFDFPWTDLEDPQFSEPAAVTNLFFMSNYMHDFTYAYGFDESAGNFQQTNYTGEGVGNDAVNSMAQDGRNVHYAAIADNDPENDDVSINNANMFTPAEGASPRMQMFVWNTANISSGQLEVTSPSALAGTYETGTADFGPAVTDNPIIGGELAFSFDGDPQTPEFNCFEVVNPEDIAGKVAVVQRGGCLFRDKTLNAQAAGAIAVIICNFEDGVINMTAPVDPDIPTVTIPTLMVSSADCARINFDLEAGETVTVNLGNVVAVGADFYDGDVDNGIIAHEYGHGISNRLVAGPTAAGCVGNTENLGEGWSDFFTLVTTIKPGDVGTGKHGIGTYIRREDTNGDGIRTSPYSTDFAINSSTYDDVPLVAVDADTGVPSVHGIGEMWTSMLWDMYWGLVEEYGFDNDIVNGEGGNNIAVRLVMEGMKFTPCSPGFVDARDGILTADEFLFDGANSCIIWQAFARRGLGIDASQGSSQDHTDGISDFNFPSSCSNAMSVRKRIASEDRFADVVNPGAAVPMEIIVRNDKMDTATGIVLTESIPAGATIENISAEGTIQGDNIVWELDALEVGQEMTYTYTLNVDPDRSSSTLFKDDLETGGPSWVPLSESTNDATQTENLFTLSTAADVLGTNSGNAAYFVADVDIDTRENLLLLQPLQVQGDNPGLRFFQNYDTEAFSDGTLIQVSLDGQIWQEIPDMIFKNGYPRTIQFGTFTIPFLSAFSGNSDGWIDSWVDLSAFQGQEIFVRFRFGTDNNTAGIGWAMDDFEFLNIVSYNTTATMTSAQGDLIEIELPDGGIKIDTDGTIAVDDANNPSLEVNIYPNPASETVNIAINNITADDAQLSVFNYSGLLIEERTLNLNTGSQLEEINVRNYPSGFYFFQLTTDRGVGVEKVMVGK